MADCTYSVLDTVFSGCVEVICSTALFLDSFKLESKWGQNDG